MNVTSILVINIWVNKCLNGILRCHKYRNIKIVTYMVLYII